MRFSDQPETIDVARNEGLAAALDLLKKFDEGQLAALQPIF